ncbi:MAG: monofunctional biosynthetic peptidoglycan transglycosylase [Cellvibrionaceae bacterium]
MSFFKKYRLKAIKFFSLLILFFLFITIILTLPLRWINPPTTAFVLRDDNINYSLSEYWFEYDAIAPDVLLAIIAAEDQKFPNHFGFDFQSIKKSLSEKRSKVRGASTITQQLVKNVYLWSGRSLFRKGVEAWLTLWLELFLPKERILEIYVNVVEFGTGVYGVGKASEKYYGQAPSHLNRIQASLLAAVLPSPKRLSVSTPSDYLLGRASDIRFSMRALGGIGYLPPK